MSASETAIFMPVSEHRTVGEFCLAFGETRPSAPVLDAMASAMVDLDEGRHVQNCYMCHLPVADFAAFGGAYISKMDAPKPSIALICRDCLWAMEADDMADDDVE